MIYYFFIPNFIISSSYFGKLISQLKLLNKNYFYFTCIYIYM